MEHWTLRLEFLRDLFEFFELKTSSVNLMKRRNKKYFLPFQFCFDIETFVWFFQSRWDRWIFPFCGWRDFAPAYLALTAQMVVVIQAEMLAIPSVTHQFQSRVINFLKNYPIFCMHKICTKTSALPCRVHRLIASLESSFPMIVSVDAGPVLSIEFRFVIRSVWILFWSNG